MILNARFTSTDAMLDTTFVSNTTDMRTQFESSDIDMDAKFESNVGTMSASFESNDVGITPRFADVQQVPSGELDAYLKSAVAAYLANSLPVASADKLGAVKVGESLAIDGDGILNVNSVDIVEEDNSLPITSAAVYSEVGNINVLLASI